MAMLYVRNTECALNKLLWIHIYHVMKKIVIFFILVT